MKSLAAAEGRGNSISRVCSVTTWLWYEAHYRLIS